MTAVFGEDETTLRSVSDVFTLMEMAPHDCYGEITPPEEVVDDVLLCSGGTVIGLISAAHLAVVDSRDLWQAAEAIRNQRSVAPS